MAILNNEIGNKYGRLEVIYRADNVGTRASWVCKCECGNEKIVSGKMLRNGKTQSCGCLRKEVASKQNTLMVHSDVYKRAEQLGHKLLEQYKGSQEKHLFSCGKGHTFSLNATDVINGIRKCPTCVEKSSPKRNNSFYNQKWLSRNPDKANAECELYYLKFSNENEEFIKVGITIQGIKERVRKLKAHYNIEVIKVVKSTLQYCFNVESRFKRMYDKYRYEPMIKFNGYKECFNAR